MIIRLSDIYCDAKQTIEEGLEFKRLGIRKYGVPFINPCDITHYHIDSVDSSLEEGPANIDLTITYIERVVNRDDTFKSVEKTQVLRVLCNSGDFDWTYSMINKVWDGEYPSSVAINLETHVIYLFNVRVGTIELVEFGVLTDNQFNAFNFDGSTQKPFAIKLDSDAMFKFIDGAEGFNHLRNNVFIMLDCIVPIRIDIS